MRPPPPPTDQSTFETDCKAVHRKDGHAIAERARINHIPTRTRSCPAWGRLVVLNGSRERKPRRSLSCGARTIKKRSSGVGGLRGSLRGIAPVLGTGRGFAGRRRETSARRGRAAFAFFSASAGRA